MDYREWPLPDALDGLIKAVWTLDAGGASTAMVAQDAVPDGCVEIIRRLAGTSEWGGPQPEHFVAGIIEAPARLHMSGDARFVGIRLWPWAWNLLDGPPATQFLGDWRPLPPESLAALLVADPEHVAAALADSFAGIEPAPFAQHVRRSRSVAELSIRSGLSYRQIQRWFTAEIGIAPRRYLKLMRFQQAFADVQRNPRRLAIHAAAHGYADQAHMARDFREMAGEPATAARKSARGPFLPASQP